MCEGREEAKGRRRETKRSEGESVFLTIYMTDRLSMMMKLSWLSFYIFEGVGIWDLFCVRYGEYYDTHTALLLVILRFPPLPSPPARRSLSLSLLRVGGVQDYI